MKISGKKNRVKLIVILLITLFVFSGCGSNFNYNSETEDYGSEESYSQESKPEENPAVDLSISDVHVEQAFHSVTVTGRVTNNSRYYNYQHITVKVDYLDGNRSVVNTDYVYADSYNRALGTGETTTFTAIMNDADDVGDCRVTVSSAD